MGANTVPATQHDDTHLLATHAGEGRRKPAHLGVDVLIREAQKLNQSANLEISHTRLVRIVRRFARGSHNDGLSLDAYLRATFALDPTGVTAARNVDRERAQ